MRKLRFSADSIQPTKIIFPRNRTTLDTDTTTNLRTLQQTVIHLRIISKKNINTKAVQHRLPPRFKSVIGQDTIAKDRRVKKYRQGVPKGVTGMRKPVPDRPSMQKA